MRTIGSRTSGRGRPRKERNDRVTSLTLGTLAGGAATALAFPVGYATIGLVLSLRRPANPIGWLYAASGLAWALDLPFGPWLDQLIHDHWPLPVAAQLAAVAGGFLWAPGVGFGITLPFLLLPDGRLRSPGWRVVVVTAVTGAGLVLAAGSLLPGRLGETSIANPFALAGLAGTVATCYSSRPGVACGQRGGGAGLAGPAVPGLGRGRAPAAPLGRRRRGRRRGRAAAKHPGRPGHRAKVQ